MGGWVGGWVEEMVRGACSGPAARFPLRNVGFESRKFSSFLFCVFVGEWIGKRWE